MTDTEQKTIGMFIWDMVYFSMYSSLCVIMFIEYEIVQTMPGVNTVHIKTMKHEQVMSLK